MRCTPFIFPLIALAACVVASAQTPAENPARGRAKFWSYQPIAHPAAPAVNDTDWPRNDIDRFLLAKLENKGLKPVADADAVTLLRRVYFDLIGLPPTPRQIQSYVNDPSPDRYQQTVDRLLASPQFGERWGRHWLDVARFGESLTLRGFILKDAWRYRDYVIDAFNQDRPFDRFMAEQVAGDLMPADSLQAHRRQMIATTFLMLGNHNLEEQDKKQLEMDVVDEQINAISTAFIGQTVGCARCHDHKFDPIPTRDYYGLAGILHSAQALEHANVSKWLELPLPMPAEQEAAIQKQETAVAALQARIAQAKSSLAKSKSPKSAAGAIAIADLPGVVVDDSKARQVGSWKHSTFTRPYIGDGYLTDNNDHTQAKTLTFQPEIPEAGKYEVRFAYTAGGNRANNVTVTVFSADGSQMVTVNEKETPPIDGLFISLGRHTFEKNGQGFVLVSTEGADGYVIADAVQFLPADGAAAAAPVASSAAGATPAAPLAAVASASSASVKELEAQLKKLVDEGPHRDTVISVRESKQIGDARIHLRGNVHTLGDVAPRGFMQVVSLDHPPIIPPTESGRRELGEWLADPENPLPARVMANRCWHWIFGAGLVRTPDNFGTTGELPSHPELLDYLATQFAANHWSVKSVVRQIVLSHAYQLSTANDARAQGVDAENRLLWRMNRRRLDAECIRDAILSASAELSLEAGGCSYDPSLKADFGYNKPTNRRSVYVPIFRNALPEIFTVFDFADSSVPTGRRNVSTVAPQALFMLNSPFVIDQSRKAAVHLLADKSCADDTARIDQAYQLVLGRMPGDAERKMMLDCIAQGPGSAPEKWEQVFHALFASIDFRYLN